MAENTFVFENQDFNVDKDSNLWKLSLKRSEVGTQQLQQLQLLEIKHPLLMPMTTAVDADTIQFQFESEDHGLSFDTIKSQTLAEQLRFALNVLDLEQALTLPVHFILHPENLFTQRMLQPKLPTVVYQKLWFQENLAKMNFSINTNVSFTLSLQIMILVIFIMVLLLSLMHQLF